MILNNFDRYLLLLNLLLRLLQWRPCVTHLTQTVTLERSRISRQTSKLCLILTTSIATMLLATQTVMSTIAKNIAVASSNRLSDMICGVNTINQLESCDSRSLQNSNNNSITDSIRFNISNQRCSPKLESLTFIFSYFRRVAGRRGLLLHDLPRNRLFEDVVIDRIN